MCYNSLCLDEQNIGTLCFIEAASFPQLDIVGKAPSASGIRPGCSSRQRQQTNGGRFVMLKRCSHCGVQKPLTEFTKNKSEKDGYWVWCKKCCTKYNKIRWAKAHPPKPVIAYDSTIEKPCPKCKRILPLNSFSPDWRGKHGRSSWCHECIRPRKAKWDAINKAKRTAQKPEKEARKQAAREADWERKRNNPPLNATPLQKWRYANPEKVTAQRSRWCKAHPDRKASDQAKRKAIKSKVETKYVDYKTILIRDGYKCHICGKSVLPNQLSFDHVIPLSKGGPHIESNIKVAHLSCNCRKGAKTFTEAWI